MATPQTNLAQRHRSWMGALTLAALALGPVACENGTPIEPSPSLNAIHQQAVTKALAVRQEALTEIAQAIAISLQDPATRIGLRNDLRASRFGHEHKLEMGSYLASNRTLSAAKLAKAHKKSESALATALADGYRVELYMPVAAHREKWTGSGDLIVAAQVSDQTVPVGFHLDGSPAELSLTAPPETPTIVIVPSETNFSAPLDPAEWKNTNDANGVIGTYRHITESVVTRNPGDISRKIVDPCGGPITEETPPECGGSYPPPATYPSGLYLDYSHLDDWKESWPRGDPEVQAFLIAPTFSPSADGEKLSCSGDNVDGYKRFDQNGHDWSAPIWSVEGQLFSSAEFTQYAGVYNKPFSVVFWEDDTDSCEIRTDHRSIIEQVSQDLSAVRAAATVIISWLNPVYPTTFFFSNSAAQAIRGLALLNLWDREDDYLGQLTLQAGTGYNFPGATHLIVLESNGGELRTNGYVRLRYR